MLSATSSGSRAALMLALLAPFLATAGGALPGRVQPGDPLPDLRLTDQKGAVVNLGPPGDEVHLLLFLRHLHKYEEQASQDLRKIADGLSGTSLQVHVVWVALEQDAAMPDLDLGGATWFDREREAVEALGIIVYPTTVLISKDRKILERIPSRPPSYSHLIESAVKQELGLIDAEEFQRLRGEQAALKQIGSASAKARLLASFAEKLTRGGKFDQAGPKFLQAMKLSGDDPKVGRPYASFLLETGKLSEARALVDRMLLQSPAHSGLRRVDARILAREGKHEAAAKILEEILPLTPDKAPVLFELGQVRAAQEQWQAAAKRYHEALQLLLEGR